jgi:hypothetical protein
MGFLSRLLAIGGVAGVIAIMITAAILYRYIENGPAEQIPEVLSHALTTILGFYFGSSAVAAGRAAERDRNPN